MTFDIKQLNMLVQLRGRIRLIERLCQRFYKSRNLDMLGIRRNTKDLPKK